MVKRKKKVKGKVYVLKLTCAECGNNFSSERYRKYCNWNCQRKANAGFQKVRYAEMRQIVLKAKGVIK